MSNPMLYLAISVCLACFWAGVACALALLGKLSAQGIPVVFVLTLLVCFGTLAGLSMGRVQSC